MTAAQAIWNGYCDVLAIALARRYGLETMGAFELLRDGGRGFLCHAFCMLPDGRIVDCDGISPMIRPEECSSSPDPEVVGFVVVPTGENDPHLISLARHDYEAEIERLDAYGWIEENLAGALEQAGVRPVAGPAPTP